MTVKKIHMPGREEKIGFEETPDGYIRANLPEVEGHAMCVIET